MTPKTKIFLITKDQDMVSQIDAVARNGSPIEVDQVLPDTGRIDKYLETSGVCAGIVDIDPDPQAALEDLESMVRDNPHLCTIVISENMNQELILSAMLAGARHFLQKGSIHEQLSGVMARLLTHTGVKQRTGSVLTVFSASGGCGATTIALNLANELRLKTSKGVLVIDLDRCYGAASAFLDIKSEYGIDDVLTYEGKIDKHLIQSSSCAYKEDFHILLSSAGKSNKTEKGWGSQGLSDVLHACRLAYGYTVVDAPRMDEQTVKMLSELSDFTIVVFQLTLKDLKFARSIIKMFKDLGLSEDKIIPLANRYTKSRFGKSGSLISIDDSRRVLGADNVVSICSDWPNAEKSLNVAKPLADAAPRSAMRKDLQKLVDRIQSHSDE
ncbi:MAG: AAA family ATPase [Phycisphaerae bacterium]|nr:AAA family ATPase [Phycisphaerae bacterium]